MALFLSILPFVLLLLFLSNSFCYQFYVDPFISKPFLEKNQTYRNLTEAILDANKDDSATIIFLKEEYVYELEGLIEIQNELIFQNYDSNYLVGMQSATLIMKNSSFFIKDQAKLKMKGIKIVLKGTYLSSLIGAGEASCLFLENFEISCPPSFLPPLLLLNISQAKIISLNNLIISSLTLPYISSLLFNFTSIQQLYLYSLSFFNMEAPNTILFSFLQVQQLLISSFRLTSSTVKQAFHLQKIENLKIYDLQLYDNEIFDMFVWGEEVNGAGEQIVFDTWMIRNNSYSSQQEGDALLLFLSSSSSSLLLRNAVIRDNLGGIRRLFLFQKLKERVDFDMVAFLNNTSGNFHVSFIDNPFIYLKNVSCLSLNPLSSSSSPKSAFEVVNSLVMDIIHSVFEDNFALNYPAVFLIIQNLDFPSLYASEDFGSILYPLLKIGFSKFDNNFAFNNENTNMMKGTSFYVGQDGRIEMVECLFERNANGFSSGITPLVAAPCLNSASLTSSLSIFSSVFLSNSATFSGSCLFFNGASLLLYSSSFLYNKDLQANSNTFGGALTFGSEISRLINLTFKGNQAYYGGGVGIFIKYPYYLHDVQLENLIFEDNHASSKGGAFFLQNYDMLTWINLKITGCFFLNNSAEKDGGVSFNHGILVVESQLLYERCIFQANSAQRGGVVYNAVLYFATVFLNCTFLENYVLSSTDGGGVFYNDDTHDLITRNCIATGNRARSRGGFGQVLKGSYYDYSSIFFNNSALDSGGIMVMHRISSLSMFSSILQSVSAFVQGGFLHLMQQCVVRLNFVKVFNASSSSGGAISIIQESDLMIADSVFEGCSAKIGSIIYSVNTVSMIVIMDSFFDRNSVQDDGLFYLLYSNIRISNATFAENSGGHFYFSNTRANISELVVKGGSCDDISNTATGGGFCLFWIEESTLSLTFSSVSSLAFTAKRTAFQLLSSSVLLKSLLLLNTSCLLSPNFSKTDSAALKDGDCLLIASKSTLVLEQGLYQQFSGLGLRLRGTSIKIHQTTVQGGAPTQGGAHTLLSTKKWLICEECEGIEVSGGWFEGMKADEGSVFSLKSTRIIPILAMIVNSTFANNSVSYSGGAISTADTAIHIENCTFLNNSAKIGGAIYFNCSSYNLSSYEKSIPNKWDGFCDFRLKNNSFNENRGGEGGGAYFWLGEKPKGEELNYFRDNRAMYGPDRASVPLSIKLQEIERNFSQIASGQTLKCNITFFLLDFYSQICSSISSGVMTLGFNENDNAENSARKSILGNKVVAIRNGEANFSNLNLISTPNHSTQFIIKSKEVQKEINTEYEMEFSLFFRSCQTGEIFKEIENICFPCPELFYSFNPLYPTCLSCPQNADCPGGSIISARENFWRSSNLSALVFECSVLKNGCKGGENPDGICNFGYEGPLCGGCTYNKDTKYFKSVFKTCVECQGVSGTGVVIILFFFVVAVTVIVVTVKETMRRASERKEKKSISRITNIMVNYIQMISITSNVEIAWPEAMKESNNVMNSSGDLENIIGVFECPFSEVAFNEGVTLYTIKTSLGSVFILGVFCFIFTFWGIIYVIKRKSMKNYLIITFISIYLLILQPMIKFYTKALHCVNIDGKNYLKSFPLLECGSNEHNWLVHFCVIPLFVFLVILPPLLYLYYLIKGRFNKEDETYRSRAFLITNGYKSEFFYWEFLILTKKILLLFISIFLNDRQLIACLLIVLFILFFNLLQINFKPYVFSSFNNIEIIQNNVVFLNFVVIIFFFFVSHPAAILALALIFLIANLIFFLAWARTLFIFFLDKNPALKRKLIRYFGYLKSTLKVFPKRSASRKEMESLEVKSIKKDSEKIDDGRD